MSNLSRTSPISLGGNGEQLCYIGEAGPDLPINRDYPNLGPRISIYNLKGDRLARLGDIRGGEKPNQFMAPHGIAMDSRRDLYIGEVSWTWASAVHDMVPPKGLQSLRKLVKLG